MEGSGMCLHDASKEKMVPGDTDPSPKSRVLRPRPICFSNWDEPTPDYKLSDPNFATTVLEMCPTYARLCCLGVETWDLGLFSPQLAFLRQFLDLRQGAVQLGLQ